jgi:hypothetical protein
LSLSYLAARLTLKAVNPGMFSAERVTVTFDCGSQGRNFET